MRTIVLIEGYDRSRHPKAHTYRAMTIEEIKRLAAGDHVWFVANDGKARQCKVNGRVRTWATDEGRIEVPVKYGLYQYARLSADEAVARLIVPIEAEA